MHTLDTLLDSIPSPLTPGGVEPALAQAQGTLAAGELAADTPVAWLQQVADALSQKAAQDEAWAQTLPPDLLPMAARIEAELPIWQEAVTQAMARHVSAYRDLIPLGSQPEHYPRQWLQAHQEALRSRLLARFGEAAPAPGTLTAYQAALTARDQAARQAQVLLSQALTAAMLERQLEPLQGWVQQAMRAEIQLQVAEGRMPDAVLDILDAPTRPPVYLGLRWSGWHLPGAWVLSNVQPWGSRTHELPLLLWVHGEGGGLAYFEDLPTLQERLHADLGAPLPTTLGTQAREAPQAGDGIELFPLEGGVNGRTGKPAGRCQAALASAGRRRGAVARVERLRGYRTGPGGRAGHPGHSLR